MRFNAWRMAAVGAAAIGTLIATSGISGAAPSGVHGAAARIEAAKAHRQASGSANLGGQDSTLADEQAAYDNQRVAPGTNLSGGALFAAVVAKNALPAVGGAWQEMTNEAYNAEPSNYTDPFWGNEGAGFSIVGGRTTALVQAPGDVWFAGTADGGVWVSSDQGQHWSPTFDNQPTLSIGALAVDPVDGSVFVGTGEANTSQDSYAGTGVYRTADGGGTYQRVGDDNSGNNPLESHTVFQLTFDQNGNLYAGTNDGLWRLAAGASSWVEVLAPAGEPQFPPYANQATSVQVVPGTGGMDVIAAVAWRSQDFPTNGFYQSTDGGVTWNPVSVGGDLQATDIGRTTFAYSADGTKLYAIVENPASTGLTGFFVSSGTPASVAGPWTLIADSAKLAGSGSAASTFGTPGQQAWYNQDLAVDPADPTHVYAGLEEVYQSNDSGNTWVTASPYWNYSFACDAASPPTCPNVTHPDQHAMMIADGQIVIGNDGGVYARPLSDPNENDGTWVDLNSTLRDLQYYDARAGSLPGGGLGIWGGLQDNGSSILNSGSSQMAEAAGGDGFDVIVNPANANQLAGEYVGGTMYTTTDGGHSFADFVSPTCAAQSTTGLPGGLRKGCDPAARFVTPIIQDQQVPTTWVLGGEDVWVSHAGWNTKCQQHGCNWHNAFDTGSGHSITALTSANDGNIVYAAWVAGGGNPGPAFGVGMATNFGGKWHQLNMAGLPDRYIAGVTVDPSNPAHAYAVFNGFSRRWIPGGGLGHVFETTNGGATWTDVSGNLPDIASDALVLSNGEIALATDAGVFTAAEGQGAATTWSVLGTGLPNVSVNDLTVGPGGFIYAATHGRGVWRIAF